ncbi:MAG: hypothetical protein KC423_18455 [Anaerolineales bacterium]|nr:hypothetical protein [Anaerolineales bacterium]
MTHITIGVDCSFSANGTVRVQRVQIGAAWQVVEQGRQWLDMNGRHVLIMLPGQQAREIILRPDTLTWEMALPQQHVLRV